MKTLHAARVAGVALLSLIFAACGSGGSHSVTPQSGGSAAAATSSGNAVTGSFTLKLTPSTTASVAKRTPAYVSAQSQSALLNGSGGTTSFTIARAVAVH